MVKSENGAEVGWAAVEEIVFRERGERVAALLQLHQSQGRTNGQQRLGWAADEVERRTDLWQGTGLLASSGKSLRSWATSTPGSPRSRGSRPAVADHPVRGLRMAAASGWLITPSFL